MERILKNYRDEYLGVFDSLDVFKDASFNDYIVSYTLNKDECNFSFDFDVFLPTKRKNLQRGLIWTLEQKRQLILSFILGRYVPPVVIVSEVHDWDSNKIFKVIDGKQRLTTIISFLQDEFDIILNGKSYHYSDFNYNGRGNEFMSLSFFNLKANIYYSYPDKKMTDNQIIELFKLSNFSGTPLDIEHIKWLEE